MSAKLRLLLVDDDDFIQLVISENLTALGYEVEVAQDGQEDLALPDAALWEVLFVGGSTAWKLSPAAVMVIRRAQALG